MAAMHSVQRAKHPDGGCTLNVLPCRINHNGPVNASERYWNPVVDSEGIPTSHLRGRKLWAKPVKVPEGYRGIVTNSSNRTLPQSKPPNRTRGIDEDEDEEEVADDIVVEEESAEFDEIMVWGHESLPDAEDDPYIKGIQEWIQLAEKLHSEDDVQRPGTSDIPSPRNQ